MNLLAQDESQINSWELLLLKVVNKVSLSSTQYEIIEKRYEQLQKILDAATDDILLNAHIFVQGSIELRTTIKPVPNAKNDMATVDADAIVLLPNAQNANSSDVLAALEKRFFEGSRVEEPIKPLRRGIRIIYADENPGFHIDVTPARCVPSNSKNDGYGYLEVPDREIGWKCSSPREYSKWLDSISKKEIRIIKVLKDNKTIVAMESATQDPLPTYDDYLNHNPLRATIKLLKRHRDEWAITTNKENVRPISAIITTLAAHAYDQVVYESQSKAMRPIEAMVKIIDYMPQFISRNHEGFAVLNPKDSGENFSEKWNRPNGEGANYVEAFYSWHESALNSIKLGLNNLGTRTAFESAMVEQFGVSKSFVQESINETPKSWTLPGLAARTTLNSLSLAALAGISSESDASQEKVEPVGRLG